MIIVAGSFRVREEVRGDAQAALIDMQATSRGEDGCHEYAFSWDLEDPNLVRLYEEWETDEALMAHAASPHMAAFLKLTGELADGRADFRRFVNAEAG